MQDESVYTQVNISVRQLVEFILRSGDLDNRTGGMDVNAMHDGSRIHRKFQKQAGGDYRAEVPLKIEVPVTADGESFLLVIEGRADGIFTDTVKLAGNTRQKDDDIFSLIRDISDHPEQYMIPEGEEADEPMGPLTYIDEIKTTYGDVHAIKEPVGVHRAQAMCYAYTYAKQNDLERIGVRVRYVNRENENVHDFPELFTYAELSEWFDRLVNEYAKWAAWDVRWKRERDESIKQVPFPFEYREGQRDLVAGVYRTILRKKNLFIEAPTGVGKTISTVFPAVRAMGEGLTEKIFYGTAKTIARTVAEEAFSILEKNGMKLMTVTITSKEKLCILEKPNCNPTACERACGHYDRVNDCVYDMLTHETTIDRDTINKYAERYTVCPFEMCLDVTLWADAVICDYNYLFDPTVKLKRFFEEGGKHQYCFLVDEAHNLVDRAREMYSARIVKEQILATKLVLKNHKQFANALESCNKALLNMKRECDEFEVWEDCGPLVMGLMRFAGLFEDKGKELSGEEGEAAKDLYFEARHFLNMHDIAGDDYMIYTDYEGRDFRLTLQCMDPSRNLKECLKLTRSAVFFSATLLPVMYYRDQLGGTEDDYCVYAPSPFDQKKRLLLMASDVSTKYTRRSESEYRKIADYIEIFTGARRGNYLVFFPSYKMMEDIYGIMNSTEDVILQGQSMTEAEKEEFLGSFTDEPGSSKIGFCVMGGIFGEGIDLKNDRLIGVIVVGTGLPQVCNERELFRGYFDNTKEMGFEYAYLYNGMNKVMQAAGRVIRTTEDVGSILLLDERFRNTQYRSLFPREWDDVRTVSIDTVGDVTAQFWKNVARGDGFI